MTINTNLSALFSQFIDALAAEQKKAKDGTLSPSFVAKQSQAALRQVHDELALSFDLKGDVTVLIYAYSDFVDQLLHYLWHEFARLDELDDVALLAVGGYGRGELHPYSDIDILILLADDFSSAEEGRLADFITLLWDIGLDIGHSVRSVYETKKEAENDATIMTNLLEARFLSGEQALFTQLQKIIKPENLWPAVDFFSAKRSEQLARHKRYGDTAYTVEPNIKESPGGLRDIQMITWVMQRHYGYLSLEALSEQQLLSDSEYQELLEGRNYLWTLRFALHLISKRKEDRLLFDYQRSLAHQSGYTADHANRAVESFMQRYYRTVKRLEVINEVILGVYHKRIHKQPEIEIIDDDFERHGRTLAARNHDIFVKHPQALLKIFLVMQQQDIVYLAPNTIRLLQESLPLIDDAFRENDACKAIFLDLFRQKKGVTCVLRRMNRYGVLPAYLPVFEAIVGRMQYDLFHVYTVDLHTLFVIGNLRRYALPKDNTKDHFYEQVFKKLAYPEWAYLAALFHDIAKGRGGDHSQLGADDAFRFCRQHGMDLYAASLISWLVRKHLLMSMTVQRKDISDPEVLHQFASEVVDEERLNYLYMLTVADIQATNPKLWTNWKESLLRELFLSTRKLLGHEVVLSKTSAQWVQDKCDSVLAKLAADNQCNKDNIKACQTIWARCNDDYLLRHSVDSIAWHTYLLLAHQDNNAEPLVAIREDKARGCNDVFIYAPERAWLFSIIVSTLERLNLNVVEARLSITADGHVFNTIQLTYKDGSLLDQWDTETVTKALYSALNVAETEHPKKVLDNAKMPHLSRQLKSFDYRPRIQFTQNKTHEYTEIDITALDAPGLLSRIARVLKKHNVSVHSARISTLGEQAQDTFCITADDDMLAAEAQEGLADELREQIDALLS